MAHDREAIKEHYNQHVTEGVSTQEALRQRREGPAAPLKKFHNEIKRRLIYRFGYKAEALLDYACGRGGDIHKWWSAGIKYVKGLDLSPREVEEAHRRYGELRAREADCTLEATFQQTDHLGLQVLVEDRQYDLITCMFALHYFFDAQEHLKIMLETVAANLKPGGYFIATIPDGKRIKAHLQKANGLLQKEQLILKQKWQGKDSPFGSAFVMEIPDTVVEGHEGFTEGSHEYLVFEKVLLSVAAKHGLYPVTDYDDPSMDSLFEQPDARSPVKHFNPSYPASCDSSLTLASRLYIAVVLQKVSSADLAKAPARRPPPIPQSGPRRQQRPTRERRSPTREERYAAAEEAPLNGAPVASTPANGFAIQSRPQQQSTTSLSSRPARSNWSDNWQLPYQAIILQPNQIPQAYHNVKKPEYLKERHDQLNRFVIMPPPMPQSAGPVAWDLMRNEWIRQVLPDGRVVDSYYDELQYHEQLQAATSNITQQQTMQHHHGGPMTAVGTGAGSTTNQQHQQRQQGPSMPQQQGHQQQQEQHQHVESTEPAPGPEHQLQSSGDLEAAEGAGSEGGGRARGKGRGRGRGRAAAIAAASGQEHSAANTEETAPAKRGRGGRGSRGGRTAAGAKRARQDAEDAAEVAGDSAQGQAASGPASKKAAASKPAAAGASGSKFLKGPVADPLGYKSKEVMELPAELVDQLTQLAPGYAEPVA